MTQKKTTYKGSSDAQRKAVAKYHAEKIDNIQIRVPKGKKQYYKDAADSVGSSLNQFFIDAADEKIERNNDGV